MMVPASAQPGVIGEAFARARAEGRPALIPYVMAGYPDHEQAIAIGEALVQGGADLLEVGIPFSDPLADGPTIQRVASASLAGGTTVGSCLQAVVELRLRGVEIPIVLMGYLNPILQYGVERFCIDAAAAGVNGLIVADMPLEEACELREHAEPAGLDLIYLVAPTSPNERIVQVSDAGSGFLYAVALTGVTGARSSLADSLPGFLDRVRAHSSLPVAVGFGLSTPDHVRNVGAHADGAVFASALIEYLDAVAVTGRPAAAAVFVARMRG